MGTLRASTRNVRDDLEGFRCLVPALCDFILKHAVPVTRTHFENLWMI